MNETLRTASVLRSSPLARIASALFASVTVLALVACAGTDEVTGYEDGEEDGDGDSLTDADGDDENVGSSADELKTGGPCAGTAIDRAVKCAVAKGARVLSYYRSPAEQERVRRQNGCRNRCSGMAGCVRPTADCNASPHTRCRAVDLVADGAPVSRSELRKCGLAKTSLPHRNHYDLVR